MGKRVSKSTAPEPLSIEQLLRVQARLQSRGRLTKELRACFNLVLSEFSQEPVCIQENARLTIQSEKTVLVFTSGTAENEISVFQLDGQLQYNIKIARWDASMARMFSKNLKKSVAEMIDYVPPGPVLEIMKKMGLS